MRGRAQATIELISAAINILMVQFPMTIRQLFYRLVTKNIIENTIADYKRVSRIMTTARKGGVCKYEWIVDRSRPEYKPNVWKDVAGYVNAVKKSYRRDQWQDQPYYCEIWTEKDAIVGSIEDVTNDLGVIVRTFRGFNSTTKVHDIAGHFNSMHRAGKHIRVFYLGDWDSSGECIESDIARRVLEEMRMLDQDASPFRMQRIGIHKADIGIFSLPTQQVKNSDSRAAKFKKRHGNVCVELDALPPDELRQRIKDAIENLIDWPPWDRHLIAEMAERESINRVADYLANLPRVDAPGTQDAD